jgi:hypothetical protein
MISANGRLKFISSEDGYPLLGDDLIETLLKRLYLFLDCFISNVLTLFPNEILLVCIGYSD